MINVTRERKVRHSVEQLWPILADPQNLPRILDRITQVDIGATHGEQTAVTAHFDFGKVIGIKVAEGMFTAHPKHHITFEAHKLMPIVARWTLKPNPQGTLITAELRFDLKPMLGVMARMAPTLLIRKDISVELDLALKRVDELAGKGIGHRA